ncbi:RRF domain-containing protein [Cephalotus follicularis]|uniref:Ribosome-recycling factor, chloroplastic n=1 Tax=Cephalotus follicularis TaxID=3775 RepID=A0A1Q3B8C9_CEPFO|nr:RRF domain-containing protein [Cephalotus follicularis]
MALHLRRVLDLACKRNPIFLRNNKCTDLQSRKLYHIIFSPANLSLNDTKEPHKKDPSLPSFHFLRDSSRGFAKGKKSKDDSAGGTVEVMFDIWPMAKAHAVTQMEAAVDALSRELTKLRTGRASAGMLDHIIVETSGVKMPLSRLAVVSVMDSKTLSVNPYDPNTLKELEKAIISSPLGLNPKVDGQRLVAPIPPLTKEHIQAICKVVAKSSEDVKQSIRRARQKALDAVKKRGSSVPKDEAKRLEKEIDELTKKFIKSAEDMCKAKEKEITQI